MLGWHGTSWPRCQERRDAAQSCPVHRDQEEILHLSFHKCAADIGHPQGSRPGGHRHKAQNSISERRACGWSCQWTVPCCAVTPSLEARPGLLIGHLLRKTLANLGLNQSHCPASIMGGEKAGLKSIHHSVVTSSNQIRTQGSGGRLRSRSPLNGTQGPKVLKMYFT